jgi:hypothetical protein
MMGSRPRMSLPAMSMAVLRQLADPSSGMWEACGYQHPCRSQAACRG